MTDRHDDPLDDVVAAFQRMPVPETPGPELLFRRPTAPSATGETAGNTPSRILWRFLMRPKVRYGSAVAIIVVALGWLALGQSRSFAFAEVVRAAEQHKVVRYKFHWIGGHKVGEPSESKGTVFVDLLLPRTRFESDPEPYGNGASLFQVTVHDRRTGATLNETNVSRRVAGNDGQERIEVQPLFMTHFQPGGADDSHSASIRPIWGDILPVSGISAKTPFLDALRAIESRKETISTKDQLDGRVVVKFSAKEGSSSYTVWVDPETKLPVRIENAFPDSSQDGAISRLVCTDFVWDPKVADIEAFFRAEPPQRDPGKKDAKPGP